MSCSALESERADLIRLLKTAIGTHAGILIFHRCLSEAAQNYTGYLNLIEGAIDIIYI